MTLKAAKPVSLAFACWLFVAVASTAAQSSPDMTWHSDVYRALDAASVAGKPVFVYVYDSV